MEKSNIITLAIMFVVILIAILISRFKTSKQFEIKRKIRLFPYWVKYLGIVISILSIIIHWSNLAEKSTVLSSFWQFGFAIGLLIIGLSKERNEDEMTMSIRLNSVFISFFTGIIVHIFFVLLELLYGGSVNSFNSLYATNFILFLYVINFHLTKKTMHK